MVQVYQWGGGLMNEFSEVRETKSRMTQEVENKSLGFENAKNDVNEPRHIKTINENLDGKTYPETDILYKKNTFRLDGEKVEGVFPVFNSKFNTALSKNLWKASDSEQFKYCTEKLKQKIEKNPEFSKQFTPRQLEQIENGEPRISGLTWHHNEVPGKMELVNSADHEKCRHTGGRNIWGGGSDYR